MAVTLDLKIKPYTDTADVKKVANELKEALTNELEKHGNSKDKRMMSLNMQVKKTIESVNELEKKLEDLSNQSYKPKYAKELESLTDKMVDVKYKIKDAQAKQAVSPNPGLYDGMIDSLKKQLESLNAQYNSLSQAEAAEQEAWSNDNAAAQQKVRQQIDSTNDRMKVQMMQYQQLGTAAKALGNVVIPVFGAIGKGLVGAFAQFPRTIRGILQGVAKLSKAFHPNLSDGVKAIVTQIKRATGILIGFALGARGLQSILNKLRNWIMTGFKDIYNQDEQFKTQIDTIKQKVMDIQVALAEAFMPVIQMLLPYIKQLLDWILSLFGAISRFISTITGIQAYTKAIKGLGGAAQNANKQLSKLDELNNYTTGGGNGLTPDDSSIGDPKKIEDWFQFVRNIVDEIEKLLRSIPWDEVYKKAEKFGENVGHILNAVFKPSFWNAIGMTVGGVLNTLVHFFNTLGDTLVFANIGKSFVESIRGFLDMFDWGLLSDTLITWADGFWTIIKTILTDRDSNGQTLAEKIVELITNALSNINWSVVLTKVHEIGQTLAETLNQIVDPDLAYEIGKTLGGLLMTAVEFAIAFFGDGGFDWSNLGDTIANAINGFFAMFDGKKFATAINNIINGLLTTLKTILAQVDWTAVEDDIKGFLQTIDWKVIFAVIIPSVIQFLKPIVKTIWNIFSAWLLKEITQNAGFFGLLVNKIATGIGTALTGLVAGIIAALGGYQIGNGIGEIISLITGDYESAEEYESMSIPAIIIKALGLDWDSSRWDEVWQETFDAIGLDKVILWVEDTLSTLWDRVSVDNFGEFLSVLFLGDNSSLGEIVDGWSEIYDKIVELATEALTKLVTGWMSSLTDIINNIGVWWDTEFAPWFDLPKWTGLFSTIKEALSQIWTEAVLFWTTEVPKWWNENVSPWFTYEKWYGIIKSIYNAMSNVWTELKTWWNTNISAWWTDNVSPWFTYEKWSGLLKNVENAFSSAFKGAANAAISCMNKVLESVENLVNSGAVTGLNWLIDKANLLDGVDIPKISGTFTLPKIPALAQGMVVPPTMGRFMAELGDNKQETEVVSPLSTMKEAFIEAMLEGGFGNGGGDINITLEVDGRTLAKTLVRQNEISKKSTGRPLFA